MFHERGVKWNEKENKRNPSHYSDCRPSARERGFLRWRSWFTFSEKTVNFDDPGTYHLYFGNEGGKPGTIITFFPWAGARRGVIGDGQVGVTSYVVPKGAMAFWENRLAKFNVPYTK